MFELLFYFLVFVLICAVPTACLAFLIWIWRKTGRKR